MTWKFWGRKKPVTDEPLEHPETHPVVVSARTREYFELVKDIAYFNCASNTVVYDSSGKPIWECGGCDDCEQYGQPDIYRHIRTGLNMLRKHVPVQHVKETCFHPAYRKILANARDARIGEGESKYLVNILLHLGGNLDEVLAIMEETPEERQQTLEELRDEQEQLAAEKGRVIESAGE